MSGLTIAFLLIGAFLLAAPALRFVERHWRTPTAGSTASAGRSG